MRTLVLALLLQLWATACLAQHASLLPARDCLPPEEPFIPGEDAELRRYAAQIAADFERYFAEISDYLACIDASRQAAFLRAQQISAQHRSFRDRLDELGVTGEAAVDHPPLSDHEKPE